MTQRNWFITGINRGLGRQLAEALLAHGDRVAGTARRVGELADLQAKYGERLWVTELDMTDTERIQRVVDAAFEVFGRIDVVVNNAGYSLAGAAEECSEAMIRHQLDTNLLAPIMVVKAALPHLRAQGGGRILQVSSGCGQLGYAGLSLYVASKWGIEGFFESLAAEVASFGIETTLFEPGAIRTDFGRTGQLPPEIAAYRDTPAGAMRQGAEYLRNAGSGASMANGDPAKMARVMIDSVNISPAPRRIAMGSDIYDALLAAYRERAATLEAQRDLVFSTDF